MVAEEWDRETANGFEWRRRWESAFSNGFERTDNEILKEAVSLEMVGSTAVSVVLSGCQIITSNCGDSRALLCRGTQTIPLTVDQKVSFHYDYVNSLVFTLVIIYLHPKGFASTLSLYIYLHVVLWTLFLNSMHTPWLINVNTIYNIT